MNKPIIKNCSVILEIYCGALLFKMTRSEKMDLKYDILIEEYLKNRDRSKVYAETCIENLEKGLNISDDEMLDSVILFRKNEISPFKSNKIGDPTFSSLNTCNKIKESISEEISYRSHLINYYYCLLLLYAKIETSLNIISMEEKEIIEKYYFENEKISSIMNDLEIGAGKFYKIQKSALDKIRKHVQSQLFDEILFEEN